MALGRGRERPAIERAADYAAFIAGRRYTKALGHRVAEKIAQGRDASRRKLEQLVEQGDTAKLYLDAAERLGVKLTKWHRPRTVEAAMAELRALQEPWLRHLLDSKDQTERVLEQLGRAITAAETAQLYVADFGDGKDKPQGADQNGSYCPPVP
jgi:hypothetical protein